MIKIMYSKKKDEVLLLDKGVLVDFADNKWDPKNKYTKALFGRIVTLQTFKEERSVVQKGERRGKT